MDHPLRSFLLLRHPKNQKKICDYLLDHLKNEKEEVEGIQDCWQRKVVLNQQKKRQDRFRLVEACDLDLCLNSSGEVSLDEVKDLRNWWMREVAWQQ